MANPDNDTKSGPVVIPDPRPGKWNYFVRDKDGNFIQSEFETPPPRTEKIDGQNGNRDTINEIKFYKPATPPKDIPKKKLIMK